MELEVEVEREYSTVCRVLITFILWAEEKKLALSHWMWSRNMDQPAVCLIIWIEETVRIPDWMVVPRFEGVRVHGSWCVLNCMQLNCFDLVWMSFLLSYNRSVHFCACVCRIGKTLSPSLEKKQLTIKFVFCFVSFQIHHGRGECFWVFSYASIQHGSKESLSSVKRKITFRLRLMIRLIT